MVASSTSFRLSQRARQLLADRADREGTSATALLERLILEGVDALDHPGIVFRGPAHDRRAALAAGPDVWEVIARLRELTGSEEERIAVLAGETDLHPRQIRVAIEYAAVRAPEVDARIQRHHTAVEASKRSVGQRASLLA